MSAWSSTLIDINPGVLKSLYHLCKAKVHMSYVLVFDCSTLEILIIVTFSPFNFCSLLCTSRYRHELTIIYVEKNGSISRHTVVCRAAQEAGA